MHIEGTIIGIDPGSRISGFAVLSYRRPQPIRPQDFQLIDAGVVKISGKIPATVRLGMVHQEIFKIIQNYNPTFCVMEKSFFGPNAVTGIRLGEIRGAIMAAIRRQNIDVQEIAPTRVKKLITGSGAASKDEVCRAVEGFFSFKRGLLPLDLTDAVAIALAQGLQMGFG